MIKFYLERHESIELVHEVDVSLEYLIKCRPAILTWMKSEAKGNRYTIPIKKPCGIMDAGNKIVFNVLFDTVTDTYYR